MKRDHVSEICVYCHFDVFTFVIYGKFAMLFWLPLDFMVKFRKCCQVKLILTQGIDHTDFACFVAWQGTERVQEPLNIPKNM